MDYAYTIVCKEEAEAALANLYVRAVTRGEGQRLTAASHAIDEHLKWRPLEFGEPLYQSAEVGLVRMGIVAPLVVYFGVDEKKHVVSVLRYVPLPGQG